MKFLLTFFILSMCFQNSLAKNKFEKIYYGKVVSENLPWMVSLQNVDSHVCGGVAINSRVILTAAHCAGMFNKVVFGSDLSNPINSIELNDEVDEVVTHYAYRSGVSEHDIAAIILNDGIDIIEYAKIKNNVTIDESSVYVMGWGHTEQSDLSNLLLKTEMKLLDYNTCIDTFPHYESADSIKIFDHYSICAWHEKNDSCSGDSGGPLFDSDKNIIGLVSFGAECGMGLPSVYTKLESYTQWIDDVIYLYDSKISVLAPVISPPLREGKKVSVPFAVKSLGSNQNYVNNTLISNIDYEVINSEITVEYLNETEIHPSLNINGIDINFNYTLQRFNLIDRTHNLYSYFQTTENIFATFDHEILSNKWSGQNYENGILVLGDQEGVNLKDANAHALILELVGPKTITWKIGASTATNDQFKIKLNGESIDEFNRSWNSTEFIQYGLFIPVGNHTIELGYYKDKSGSLFTDSVALNNFNIIEGNILPSNSEAYAVFYKGADDIIINELIVNNILRENDFETGSYNLKFLLSMCFVLYAIKSFKRKKRSCLLE